MYPNLNREAPGNFVLIGDVGSGKSTLIKHLFDHAAPVTKTQALEFHGENVIDSPGEFASRRYLYGALLDSIVGVDTIVYLHAADQRSAVIPGDLLRMYGGKHLVGVVSKVDLEQADVVRAEACLAQAGIPPPYWRISVSDADSISALADYLCRLQRGESSETRMAGNENPGECEHDQSLS